MSELIEACYLVLQDSLTPQDKSRYMDTLLLLYKRESLWQYVYQFLYKCNLLVRIIFDISPHTWQKPKLLLALRIPEIYDFLGSLKDSNTTRLEGLIKDPKAMEQRNSNHKVGETTASIVTQVPTVLSPFISSIPSIVTRSPCATFCKVLVKGKRSSPLKKRRRRRKRQPTYVCYTYTKFYICITTLSDIAVSRRRRSKWVLLERLNADFVTVYSTPCMFPSLRVTHSTSCTLHGKGSASRQHIWLCKHY